MKIKLLILIALMITSQIGFAQTSYDPCYDPAWDWTVPTSWEIFLPENLMPSGKYHGVTHYPFQETEMNRDYRLILQNNDLSPENGWVLLQKNLGCEKQAANQPYAIFYNTYRGLIRIVALNRNNEAASLGLTTVDWVSGKRTSLLTYCNQAAKSNDSYPDNSQDMVMIQLENYSINQWWVAEFNVAFDEKTTLDDIGYVLNIKVYNVINSNLQFTSQVDLVSQTMEIKGSKAQKPSSVIDQTREWAVQGQSVVQKLNVDEWDDYLQQTNEAIIDIGLWAQDQWEKNESFGWLFNASMDAINITGNGKFADLLHNGASALGSVGNALGVTVDLIDMFCGRPSNSSMPQMIQFAPFQTTGTITSEGKIQTKTQSQSFTFALPGTVNDFPYYNCPLGVMSIKSEIAGSIRTWEEKKLKWENMSIEKLYKYEDVLSGFYWSKNKRPGYKSEETYLKYSAYSTPSSPDEKWKSVNIAEPLQISVNSAANLELVDAKVALVGTIMKNAQGGPAYNLFEQYDMLPNNALNADYIIHAEPWSNYMQGWTMKTTIDQQREPIDLARRKRWLNKTFHFIQNGVYRLIDGGEVINTSNGKRNECYSFRTKFVDIKDSYGLTIVAREETKITLKISTTWKDVIDPDKPLTVFVNEYDVIEKQMMPSNIKAEIQAPFLHAQIDDNSFTDELHIERGFYVYMPFPRMFYEDLIMDIPQKPLTELVKYYKKGQASISWQQCDCEVNYHASREGVKSKKSKDKIDQSLGNIINQTVIKVYPNSFNDVLTITDLGKNSIITIYDMLGCKKSTIKTNNEKMIQINTSNYANGMYLLRVIENDEIVFSDKIVKR